MLGAVLMVIGAACGSASETVAEKIIENQTGAEVDIDADGGSMQVIDEEGNTVNVQASDDSVVISGTDESGSETNIEMGGTEIPKGFPMPIPDGAEVSFVSSIETPEGISYSVTVEIDPNDTADVLEMYMTWYADEGLEVTSSESMVVGHGETTASLVQIADYGDYAEVILTWSPTG